MREDLHICLPRRSRSQGGLDSPTLRYNFDYALSNGPGSQLSRLRCQSFPSNVYSPLDHPRLESRPSRERNCYCADCWEIQNEDMGALPS